MRARNIKPGFFKNERLPECDALARLLFIGLWCMADKKGRMEDRPKKIKIEILPCDNCDIDSQLKQLQAQGFICRYEINNQRYIQIINFEKHQHPHHKEPDSIIPAPDSYGMRELSLPQKPEARPGPTSDPPAPTPSDSLIPDSLIPESSLNSDDARMRETKEGKRGKKTSNRIRLSHDFLPPEWSQWAQAEMGWSEQAINDVWAYFRDYWQGRTGSAAQKSDWDATWRVWCRKQNIHSGGQYGRSNTSGGYNYRHSQPSKSERFKQALVAGTLAELDAARGSGGNKNPV